MNNDKAVQEILKYNRETKIRFIRIYWLVIVSFLLLIISLVFVNKFIFDAYFLIGSSLTFILSIPASLLLRFVSYLEKRKIAKEVFNLSSGVNANLATLKIIRENPDIAYKLQKKYLEIEKRMNPLVYCYVKKKDREKLM